MNLVSIFESLPDFRIDRNKRHRLVDIMVLAVTAYMPVMKMKQKIFFKKGFLKFSRSWEHMMHLVGH